MVAADVCAILGLKNPATSLALLDEDEKIIHSMDTPSGVQQMSLVSEPGVNLLVIRSRRPEAKAIRRWLTHDVMPAIRKTGSYSLAAIPAQRDVATVSRRDLALMVIEAEDARIAAETRVAVLEPKAEAWDDLASGEGDYLVGDAAKILCRVEGISTGQGRLFQYLGEKGWTYRANGTSGPWRAYQAAVDRGWLTERVSMGFHVRDGVAVANPPQVRVTTKGLEKLRSMMLAGKQVTVRP